MRRRAIKKVKEKEVENHSLVFFASPSGNKQLTLNSGRALTIESSPANWVSVSINTSINGITISCNLNTLTAERNEVMVITDAIKEYRISVVQYGILAVTPETFSFNSGGGSDIFEILGGSGNFTITTSSSWLSVSGIGRNRTISVTGNQSVERSSIITINDSSTTEGVTINVSQEKMEYISMSVIPSTLSFGKSKETQPATLLGGDGNFSVIRSDYWFNAWIGDRTIYVAVEENSGLEREGLVTITDGTGAFIHISLIQDGMSIREWVYAGNEYYEGLTFDFLVNGSVFDMNTSYNLASASSTNHVFTSSILGRIYSSLSFQGFEFIIKDKDGISFTTGQYKINSTYMARTLYVINNYSDSIAGYDRVWLASQTFQDEFIEFYYGTNGFLKLSSPYRIFENPHQVLYQRVVIDSLTDDNLSYGINIAFQQNSLYLNSSWVSLSNGSSKYTPQGATSTWFLNTISWNVILQRLGTAYFWVSAYQGTSSHTYNGRYLDIYINPERIYPGYRFYRVTPGGGNVNGSYVIMPIRVSGSTTNNMIRATVDINQTGASGYGFLYVEFTNGSSYIYETICLNFGTIMG